jgi:exopolysaccharide biosynthesis polyprenyl glycosylphosphotransferase
MKKMTEEILSQKKVNKGNRNTLIIGFNRIGIQVYQRLIKYTTNKDKVLGFVDIFDPENIDTNKWPGNKYLGSIQNFKTIVQYYNITYIYIAIDTKDITLLHKIVGLCNVAQVRYEFANEINDVIYGNTIQQIFKDLDRPWEFSFRQIFDSILAFFIIILFFPLWMILSLLIILDSKGPTMYSQERIGKDGRIFRVFKFRTMFTDAEKLSGPVLATKKDPRITRVGHFLRKTRIDEIPQLINVLIGDMSFIGPRPERPYFVDKYIMEIPMYKNRSKIKPGITGLAQVTTGYDEGLEDVKLKLKYDLEYASAKDSFLLNTKILLKTIWVVLTGKGQ